LSAHGVSPAHDRRPASRRIGGKAVPTLTTQPACARPSRGC
jgi:hypothetical protein